MKTLAMLLLAAATVRSAAPPGLDQMIAAARTLPATFAADGLLRLADGESANPALRIRLLGEAFEKASAQAQPRYRLRPAFASAASAAFLVKAYAQNLDGLDLQLRAVEAMSALDAAKARQMFQEIPTPELPKLDCAAWTVYDVDPYFRQMAALGHTFSDADRKKGKLARFLEPHAALHSALEAGPMADTLADASLSESEFRPLLAAYAAALARIAGDDRSFTAAKGLGKSIEALAQECRRRKISPLPLLESYRLFLVHNLSGERCTDDAATDAVMQSALLSAAAPVPTNTSQFFNQVLVRSPLQPIQEQEATPSHLAGAATGLGGCAGEVCRSLGDQFRKLVFRPNGAMLPTAERSSPEWMDRLKKLLAALREWKPGADPAAYFREKASAYNELLPLPAGEGRALVAAAELDFLVQARKQAANSIEWFLPLNRLLAWTVLDPGSFAGLAASMRQSTDPVVAFYATLEKAAPRRPDRLMPLL